MASSKILVGVGQVTGSVSSPPSQVPKCSLLHGQVILRKLHVCLSSMIFLAAQISDLAIRAFMELGLIPLSAAADCELSPG